ncbi:hypothetical protein QTI33_00580 [Variovorax sp. J22P271]|uniref:hypothetical protein n=1 Tax=Variovorax davisae TaxID=3053515 RepID=UPI002575795D|nr:hypothetical protein [Variovorax sp. J22P271]MDM0030635.1 hypothetical protein [Variovorax sp. J22P271]
MTDFGALPASDAPAPTRPPRDGTPADGGPRTTTGSPGDPQSRFGAAASILDRLDTRPLAVRLRPRPWWRFW